MDKWMRMWMKQACIWADMSKDTTKHGACLVTGRSVVSTGYNGPPPEFDDDSVVWTRPEKYDYIVHAEANAVLAGLQVLHAYKTGKQLELWVTGKPCKDCALTIVRAGITMVWYGPIGHQLETGDELLKLGTVRMNPWPTMYSQDVSVTGVPVVPSDCNVELKVCLEQYMANPTTKVSVDMAKCFTLA